MRSMTGAAWRFFLFISYIPFLFYFTPSINLWDKACKHGNVTISSLFVLSIVILAVRVLHWLGSFLPKEKINRMESFYVIEQFPWSW